MDGPDCQPKKIARQAHAPTLPELLEEAAPVQVLKACVPATHFKGRPKGEPEPVAAPPLRCMPRLGPAWGPRALTAADRLRTMPRYRTTFLP